MKKNLFVSLIVALCLALPSMSACGEDNVVLKDWSVPVYAEYLTGNTVYISGVTVYDESGKEYDAAVSVIAPDGASVEASEGFFRAEQEGVYVIVYEIRAGNKTYSKISTVSVGKVSDSGGENQNGNSSGQNGNSSSQNGNSSGQNENSGNNNGGNQTASVLSALGVVAGSEQSFSVSGNTVTIKKPVEMSSYQSVGYQLSGWSEAVGKYVKVRVKNDTSGTVGIKYKAIVDGAEKYGDYDLSIAAGGTKSYTATTATYSASTAANISEIQLFISATSAGTITVTTELGATAFTGDSDGGNSDGEQSASDNKPEAVDRHTYDVLGDLTHVAGSDGYYTVASDGVTVNVKRTSVIDDDYKAVGWEPVGYDKTIDKSVSFDIENGTEGDVVIKYKVVLSNNDDYYVEFEPIAAGGSATFSTNIGGLEIPNPDGIKVIQLFIGNTAGRGTVRIVPRISSEEIPSVQAVKITQRKGGTVVSDKSTAEIGETVTLSIENADPDYEFAAFVVKDENGDEVSVNDGRFLMPEGNVYVTATFIQIAFHVNLVQTKGGTVSVSATKPEVGELVTISVQLDADYTLVKYIVRDAEGNEVTVSENSFVMPEKDVFVSAELYTEKTDLPSAILSYRSYDNKLTVSGFASGDETITVNSSRDYGGSIYDAVDIVASGMIGTTTVSFKITNLSSSTLRLAVWATKNAGNNYPEYYSIGSVENGTKGQGSGKDIAEITVDQGSEITVTITFAKEIDQSESSLRFSPVYDGGFVGSFTMSEIIFF
ncbi:MAG: hypothetical protein ACI4NG_06560 [Candidatus Gallimonas sp.]